MSTYRRKIEGRWVEVTAEEFHRAARAPKPAATPSGLGDLVASVATPIARALGLPCIDPATKQLRPESKCAQRKAALNRAVPFSSSSQLIIPMPSPTENRQRLLDRKSRHDDLVKRLTDSIALAEGRLALQRQQLAIAQGRSAEITAILAEESAPPPPETPPPSPA